MTKTPPITVLVDDENGAIGAVHQFDGTLFCSVCNRPITFLRYGSEQPTCACENGARFVQEAEAAVARLRENRLRLEAERGVTR